MAKSKTKSSKAQEFKLDMMSVTVLLVMAIFGGLVGYQLGRASAATEALNLFEASAMSAPHIKVEPTLMEQGGMMKK